MKLPITITYNSGEQATYIAQPPEWAKWEKAKETTIAEADGKIGIWDLMFLAYNAHKRENAGKPTKSFEIWMDTISDIQAGEASPKATQPEA